MVSLVTATAFFKPTPHDLRGFGVLFPRSSKVAALGVLFNSDIFPGRSHLRSETWIYHGEGGAKLSDRLEADRLILTGRADHSVAVYITPRPNALPLYDGAVLGAAAAVEDLPPTLAVAGNYLGSLGVSRLVDGGAAAAARLLRVHGVTADQRR
jgi:oxygen-dependent protoporphyrinogen oxidase